MLVLNLKDPVVRRIRATLPIFANTRLLARGTFCAVFETSSPDRVLKLTTDRSHYAYLTDGLAPEGPYKPQVLENHGYLEDTWTGAPLYLLEVERLRPVTPRTENSRLARRIVAYTDGEGEGQYPTQPGQVKGLTEPLAMFCEEVNYFTSNFDCVTDPRVGNFMERNDGTLVMSDPVFDHKLLRKLGRQAAAACY